MEMHLRELTIHHRPAAQDQPARVRVAYRSEPGAQPQERETGFGFRISDSDRRLIQWYLEEFLVYPWGQFRERAHQVEQLMANVGAELFEAVFGDRQTFALYAHVTDDLQSTRIFVHASSPEGIALPWELMRDPSKDEYGELARLAHAFARSQPDLKFEPAPEPTDGGRLNILMVISRPWGEQDVPFQSVARPLLELFRPHQDRIRLEVLRPPTFEQLASTLGDRPNFYHVVHFDGHGTFPDSDQLGSGSRFYGREGTPGLLVFEGESGQPQEVPGGELGKLLANKGVPVVMLNACQSGMTHPESRHPSVANQLLQAGVRGVVAMSYSVYVQTAVRFMARVYQGLINGEELARAVSLGREALWAHPQRLSPVGEIELRDWTVPALFEASPTRVMTEPVTQVRLDPELLRDSQSKAGAEIGFPEAPEYGFVGRDNAILSLERAFRAETIVLLQGMAGVGKTETAVGFARWWKETGALDDPNSRTLFFGFEHYLPLADVCDRIGHAFGGTVRRQLMTDWHLLNTEQRREVTVAILRQSPCLMIWDNFEPVAGFPEGAPTAWSAKEQQELRDFLHELRGGRTKVLLTSRRGEAWLGSIYKRVELQGLRAGETGSEVGEANELARKVLSRFLAPEEMRGLSPYKKLLAFLRGNPLAIQVILPELKHTAPDALLEALEAGTAKLPHDHSSQRRDRSLSASIAYRLDALEPALRQRLGLLVFFQRFVVANVLADMCSEPGAPSPISGLQTEDWTRVLESVAELGLLHHVAEGYYALHPALPWAFRQIGCLLVPEDSEWAERSFARCYSHVGLALMQLAKSDSRSAVLLLGFEEHNLRAALRLGLQHDWMDGVCGALNGLVELLTTQGRWAEWERIVGEVEDHLLDSDGRPLPGREDMWPALLATRQEIAHQRRRFDEEEGILTALRGHFERVGDTRNYAVVVEQTGNLSFDRHDFAAAKQWYEQALQLAREADDKHEEGILLHKFGLLAQRQRQLPEAEEWYRKSLSVRKEIADEAGMASTLHQLGVLAQEVWRFEIAERYYARALKHWTEIGNEKEKANLYHNMGAMAQDRRLFEQAERWYRESLVIRERLEDEEGQAELLNRLGFIAREQGRLDEAESWCLRSLEIARNIADPRCEHAALLHLGNIAGDRENFDAAEEHYQQGLAIAERISDDRGRAACLHQLGMVASHREQLEDAYRLYCESYEVRRAIRDSHGAAQTLYQMGGVLAAVGQLDEAERAFRKALEFAEGIGYEHGKANILHHLGAVSEDRGDFVKAEQFYEQAEAAIAGLSDPRRLTIFGESLERIRSKQAR